MRKLIIFVDVDGTLYCPDEAKRIAEENSDANYGSTDIVPVRPKLIQLISTTQESIDWYCWSAGGKSYAEMFCRQKKIDHLFKGFFGKLEDTPAITPDICIDDRDEIELQGLKFIIKS